MADKYLIETLRTLNTKATDYRKLQREYAGAFRNPGRRESLIPLIRSAAASADEAAASLGEIIVGSVMSDGITLAAGVLHKDFNEARECFHQYVRTKSLPDRDRLRGAEKQLDTAIRNTTIALKEFPIEQQPFNA